MEFYDEMPTDWVDQVVTAIETYDHKVADHHESAIVIDLDVHALRALDADPGEQLVIGWTERHGPEWGLGTVDLVGPTQTLDAVTPQELAARVHLLLTTGRAQ